MGGCLGAWALVFICGGSFSYVGGGFRAWATIFVRRRPFSEVLAVPPVFLQESGHSGGIPVDSGGMKFSRMPC